MELAQIKEQWNLVLDQLLEKDRIAWLAFFDARLVSFENNQLTLDDFKQTRNPDHTQLLISAIKTVLGITPAIIER